MFLITLLFVFLVSLLLTVQIRRYTLKYKLLDFPEARSSHTIPTPTGGGLAIVVSFVIGISFMLDFSSKAYFSLLGAGIIIAGIGIWDDLNHISAKWRLLAHFIAVFWSLFWLGMIPNFQLWHLSINSSFVVTGIAAILLVWLINLFNFMDGIDGIAAAEAVFIACTGGYFSWLNGLEDLTYISLLLAASTIGFLMLNWPPAKIFMGDVGSGFLGIMIGVVIYINILEGSSIWIWLILFAVFIVDSGVTLIIRIFNREKWYEAHCSHAYQHAAKAWGHQKVTISIILINVFILFPIAYLAYIKPAWGPALSIITLLSLVLAAVKLKAGISND